MTVLGPLTPESIGFTTMHDHLFVDSTSWWRPETFEDSELTIQKLTTSNSGLARWNALGIRDNLLISPEDYNTQLEEISTFAQAGGSCLVDPTCEGILPQPLLLRQISKDLNLHIVAGSGIYVHDAHPKWVEHASLSEIETFIDRQVRTGIGETDVLPGIIGEVGTSNPPTTREILVIRAAARVGAATDTMVGVHLTTPGMFAPEIIDAMVDEGIAVNRIVLCHMDEVLNLDYHLAVLERGATVEFDTFGFEGYFARLWKTPSDNEKMEFLVELLNLGYANQIVIGHDVALKCQLHRFGGLGYDHIPKRIIPTLINHYSVSTTDIRILTIDNPRRLLSRLGDGLEFGT